MLCFQIKYSKRSHNRRSPFYFFIFLFFSACSRSEFPLHSPCTSPAVPRQPAAQISLRSRAAMNVQDETGAGTGACLACTGKHRAHTCGRVIGQRKRRSPLATLENELAFSKPGPLMQRGCCEGCLCKGRQIQGLQDDLAEYRLVNKFRLEMARGLGVTQFYENFVWAQWLPTQQRFARTSHPPTQHDNEEGAEGGLSANVSQEVVRCHIPSPPRSPPLPYVFNLAL